MTPSTEHIAELLLRQVTGQLNATERLELDAWRGRSAANEAAYQDYIRLQPLQADLQAYAAAAERAAKQTVPLVADYTRGDDESGNGTDDTAGAGQGGTRLLRWWWAAAAVVVLATGGYYWYAQQQKAASLVKNIPAAPKEDMLPGGDKAILTLSDGTSITLDSAANGAIARQGNAAVVKRADGELEYQLNGTAPAIALQNTVRTPRGGQYRIILPDGTRVWLNAASSISYPTVFTGKERRVQVTGEVYLEVAKDAGKPFHVGIDGRSSVEVLGTRFNVNAYADEADIRVTLLEGSVQMESAVLKPGEQGIAAKNNTGNNNTITIDRKVDTDAVMAWKNGLFSFQHADIRTVLRQLSRWYDADVEFRGRVPNMEFGGEIERGLPLSDVLRNLESFGVKFKIENKTIIVL